MTTTPSEDTDTPRPIAPPPLLALACILIGVGLNAVYPLAPLPLSVAHWAGGTSIVATVILFARTIREFRLFRTTVLPHRRATSLITTGPFRYTRNPLYVGLCLLHLGIALLLDSFWTLATLPILVLLLTIGVIVREEEHLARSFGDDYRRYKSSVRRWL